MDLWMMIGDLNLILAEADKNNAILDKRMMGGFRHFVDSHEIKELCILMIESIHGAMNAMYLLLLELTVLLYQWTGDWSIQIVCFKLYPPTFQRIVPLHLSLT
jgi:hypothetical protein